MTNRKNSIYPALYIFVIFLAISIRFINLGSPALTDYEANWALQALQLSQGTHLLLGSQAAYIQLTAFLFNLFGSSNFSARIVPALFGSLVVLIPLVLRSKLGQKPSILLAFFLAIDPGILAVSRSVGSPIIALVSFGLAITFWLKGKPGWAGVFLGMGLLGGDTFWSGILGFGIAIGIMQIFDKNALIDLFLFLKPENNESSEPNPEELQTDEEKVGSKKNPLRRLFYFSVGSILIVGTAFFIRPEGLSGLASGLTTYLSGWANSSGVSPADLLIALVIYEPIALILGIWGGIRAWIRKDPLDQFLGIWAIISLILSLLYRGREVDNLVWTILPLWILATRELMNHLSVVKEEFINTLTQALLSFILMGFCWINLEGMVANFTYSSDNSPHLITIGVALTILLLTSFLVSWGWNSRIAENGLVWGIGIFLLLYTFSASIEAGSLRPEYTSELWSRGQNITQANLIINIINELSDTTTGTKNNLDMAVIGIDSPGLKWALHQFPNVLYTDALSEGSMPSIVITVEDSEPTLAASYRGNKIVVTQEPNWSETLATSQFLPWMVYHTAPQTTLSGILWARVDLFPDGSLPTSANPTP